MRAETLNDDWTPELLWLMFRERSLEIRRLKTAQRRIESRDEAPETRHVVSDIDLFKRMRGAMYIPPQPKNQ